MTTDCEYKKLVNDEEEDLKKPETTVVLVQGVVPDVMEDTPKSGSCLGAWVGGLLGFLFFGFIGVIFGSIMGWVVGPTKKKNGGGCYSCMCKCTLVSVLMLFLVTILLGLGIAYLFFHYAPFVVEEMTVPTTPSSSGSNFPMVKMTDAQLEVVENRVEQFVHQLEEDDVPPQDLVVTQKEINGLICHSDYLCGNFMVTLLDDLYREEYNLPVDMLPGGQGRSFVGSNRIAMDAENDVLELEMTTAAKHENLFEGPLLFAQLHYLITQAKSLDNNNDKLLHLFLQKGVLFGQEATSSDLLNRDLMEFLYQQDDNHDVQDAITTILDKVESVKIEEGQLTIKAVRK